MFVLKSGFGSKASNRFHQAGLALYGAKGRQLLCSHVIHKVF